MAMTQPQGKTQQTKQAALSLTNLAWKPLVNPRESSRVSFIQGEDAQNFLDEYKGRVKKDYNNASALQVLKYGAQTKEVTGSNPFAVVFADMIYRQNDITVATPADLEETLKLGDILGIKGNHYIDTGLVLRTEANPNEYLAQHLMKQIKSRNQRQEFPALILLKGLEIEKDGNSPHGLAFKFTEESQIIHAPILKSKNGSWFASADIDKATGLPTEVYNKDPSGENRQLWTSETGLSRFYLSRNLVLLSDRGDLADSNANGRVVFAARPTPCLTPAEMLSPTKSAAKFFSASSGKEAGIEAGIEAYTPKQIAKYEKIVQGVRAGELPNSRLEEIAIFLESLKK